MNECCIYIVLHLHIVMLHCYLWKCDLDALLVAAWAAAGDQWWNLHRDVRSGLWGKLGIFRLFDVSRYSRQQVSVPVLHRLRGPYKYLSVINLDSTFRFVGLYGFFLAKTQFAEELPRTTFATPSRQGQPENWRSKCCPNDWQLHFFGVPGALWCSIVVISVDLIIYVGDNLQHAVPCVTCSGNSMWLPTISVKCWTHKIAISKT